MGKVIPSPVKRWPGTVTLCDPLTFPQLIAFQNALGAAKAAADRGATQAEIDAAYLPGLLGCVEKWDLAGFPDAVTPATFPSTPMRASAVLVRTLVGAVVELITEADDVPNG